MHGDRAIRLARDLQPAVVVLDVGQMNGDGYQLLHQLKRDRRTADVPVVVTFEPQADPRGEQPAWQAGHEVPVGIRFVAKPFSMEQLVADISAVVNAHSVVKEF